MLGIAICRARLSFREARIILEVKRGLNSQSECIEAIIIDFFVFSRVTLHECDTNIRLLSWLLIGSLSHTINFPDAYVKSCPIKMDESTHIAEFVLIILANFADNSQVIARTYL